MRAHKKGTNSGTKGAASTHHTGGTSMVPPAVQFAPTSSAPIQREEWDLKELDDKGSQKSGKLNSVSKSMFDSLATKVGSEKVGLIGSVHSRLALVKEALVNRDATELRKAMMALKKQFKNGTPPDQYLQQRINELDRNSEAAINTMSAYHNVRKTGNDAPASEAPNLAELRDHILQARDAYLAGNYKDAHDLLMDHAMARRHNFIVDNFGGQDNKKNYLWYTYDKELIQKALPILEGAMAMHIKGNESIKLPYIIPKKTGESDKYYEHPELARMAIPIYLEEWMHKMQKRMREDQGLSEDVQENGGTGAFWSQNTTDFKAKAEAVSKSDSSYDASNLHMNYNEIDILAAFHDWGFPVEELGTVGGSNPRYQGREQFWGWIHGQGINK